MHHTCRYCIIDNVAFAKKNTNITFEAIKNRSLTALTIVSRAIDTEKETKNKNKKTAKRKQISIIIKIRSRQFPKQRCTKNITPPPPPPPQKKKKKTTTKNNNNNNNKKPKKKTTTKNKNKKKRLNLSTVPHDLNIAVVKPLLKNPSLDKNVLKNYSPISNLPFLSKILEKVVLHKLLSHLQENNLGNPFQSACRAGHSAETVSLRIVNDILSALDNDNISVLLLLDLSAAFDTIDHQILLSRLNSVFGIQSTALQWFQSYLSDRYQSTSVNNSSSSPSQLCTVCLRAQYLGPFSSSCTLRLSPIL